MGDEIEGKDQMRYRNRFSNPAERRIILLVNGLIVELNFFQTELYHIIHLLIKQILTSLKFGNT